MEINFSLPRVLGLLVLLAGFWLLGGFTVPIVDPQGYQDQHHVTKAWLYCVALFLFGAGCVTLVDHFVGTIDRANLRLLYVLVGLALMIGSYCWLRSLAVHETTG